MMTPLKFYKRVKAPPEYPGKTYNNRNCLLHHLVWWQNTGELVPSGYVLHHKNEDKFDNRFENLELLSNSDHCKQHGAEKVCNESLTCPECAAVFVVAARKARSRMKSNASGNICCSVECGIKHRAKRLRESKPPTEIRHGAAVAYSYHGCRCGICKEGHSLRRKEYQARKNGA